MTGCGQGQNSQVIWDQGQTGSLLPFWPCSFCFLCLIPFIPPLFLLGFFLSVAQTSLPLFLPIFFLSAAISLSVSPFLPSPTFISLSPVPFLEAYSVYQFQNRVISSSPKLWVLPKLAVQNDHQQSIYNSHITCCFYQVLTYLFKNIVLSLC